MGAAAKGGPVERKDGARKAAEHATAVVVNHAGIRGGTGSAASGGRMSRVKPGSERFGVDFFYKIMKWNVEGKT